MSIGPIPAIWPGATMFIAGTGPSLTRADLNLIGNLPSSPDICLIVVNDAFLFAPWANVLYAADAQWWRWKESIPGHSLPLRLYAAQREALTYRSNVQLVNVVKGEGISTDPSRIISGGHSGYQAIGLACHLAGGRPRQIVLLGFDMQAGRTGQHHFFGEHPRPAGCKPYHINYDDKLPRFNALSLDLAGQQIPIVNCSRSTAIPEEWIRRRSLEDVVRDCATSASRPADDQRSPHQPADPTTAGSAPVAPEAPAR